MKRDGKDSVNNIDPDTDGYRTRADRERLERIFEILEKFGDTENASVAGSGALSIKWNVLRFLFDAENSEPNSAKPIPVDADDHSGHRERLRCAIAKDKELNSFDDADIIETLLSYIVPRKDTDPIAKSMIKSVGSLKGVLTAPPDVLYSFSGMTRDAAELISTLPTAVTPDLGEKIVIDGHRSAVEYLSARFLGGDGDGTLALFLDKNFSLLGTEKLRGPQLIPINAVVGSAYKYDARYVIIGRRADEIISSKFALVNDIERASKLLDRCGIGLLDCLLFTDYGYYMLGSTEVGNMTLELSAVPLRAMSKSPELMEKLGRIARREQAVDLDDLSADIGTYNDTFDY